MAESTSGGGSGYEARQPTQPEFAFQVSKQDAVQGVTNGQQSSAQLVGGNNQSRITQPVQLDPVQGLGAASSLLDAIMQPKVAAMQKNQFWQGVTDARAGRAIKDIVESDSPLQKVFGPSNYVQGAQFYSSQNAIAKYNQNLLENVDSLAKVPPGEVGQRLNEEAQKYETGDAGTDALTHAAWVEQTGPTMAVINKTRYGQQQMAATNAFVSNINDVGTVLQSLGKHLQDGTASSDDYNGQLQLLASATKIPPGMSVETYHKLLPGLAKSFADKGQFHALRFMQVSGVLDVVPVDQRVKLDENIEKQQRQAADKFRFTPENIRLLSDWRSSLHAGALAPAQYMKNIQDLQTQFQNVTGSTETVLPGSELMSDIVGGRDNYWQAQQKYRDETRRGLAAATTAAEKAAAEAREVADLSAAIAQGAVGDAITQGASSSTVASIFVNKYTEAAPEDRDLLLTTNFQGSNYVNPVIKNRLQAAYRANTVGDTSEAAEASYKDWKRLNSTPEGAATSAAYYSEEQQTRLNRYDMLKSQAVPTAVAYKMAFQEPLTADVDFTAKYGIDKEIVGVIKDQNSSWFPATQNMNDSSQHMLARMVKKQVGVLMQNSGLSAEQAVHQTIASLRANGAEVYGSHLWTKAPNQRPLKELIRDPNGTVDNAGAAVTPERLDKVFGAFVEDRVKKSGIKDIDTQQVVRLADIRGVAQFAVIGFSKDGRSVNAYFNSKDLSEAYTKDLVKPTTTSGMGPKNTFLTKERSDAATAAYRRGFN